MSRFKLGALHRWMTADGEKVLAFPAGDDEVQTFSFRAIGMPVFVRCERLTGHGTDCDETWLVAYAEGLAEVDFSVVGSVRLVIGGRNAAVEVGPSLVSGNVIPAGEGESFTSMEPITREEVSPEIRRMMATMRANEERRHASLMAEIERLKSAKG